MPEIRVQGRGYKVHPSDCSRGDAETAQVLVTLDRAQRSLMNLLCLNFNTDFGEKKIHKPTGSPGNSFPRTLLKPGPSSLEGGERRIHRSSFVVLYKCLS